MTEIRLFFGDVLDYTRRPVQAPFFSCSFTEAISADVGWTAVLDSRVVKDMGLDLRPWRAAIYLQVPGYITGGFTGPRTWSRGEGSGYGRVEARGGGWMSYLNMRFLRLDKTYADVEQYDIVQDLVNYCQSGAHSAGGLGNIGLTLHRTPTDTGRLRDRTYRDSDLKGIRDAITEIAEVRNGFDWRPTTVWDTGIFPVRRLSLGYPSIGSNPPAAERPVIVDGSGCVVQREDYDHGSTVTQTVATGQAGDIDTEDRPYAVATSTNFGGLPLLESVESYDTIENPTVLGDHAQADLDRTRANRSVTIDVFDLTQYPLVQFQPGDRFDLVSDHPGLHEITATSKPWRVNQRTITATENGTIRQTIEAIRDEDLVGATGPFFVHPHDIRQFKRIKARRKAEELRQKVGRKKPA